jgi:hypothetical protein
LDETPLVEAPLLFAGRLLGRALEAAQAALLTALGRTTTVEPGRDHGDPHFVAEGVVDDRAEDDVGLRVGGLLDQPGRLVDLEEAEIGAPGDRQETP